MKKTMRIRKNSIARYELEVMQHGVCGSIVPLGFAEEQDVYLVEADAAGLGSFDGWFMADRSYALDGYRRLLHFLNSLVQGLCDAEKYLIPAQHLSLEPADIFTRDGRLLLMPSEDCMTALEEKVGTLLEFLERRYPQTHASYVLEQLPECCDAKVLLRLLTEMELDMAARH